MIKLSGERGRFLVDLLQARFAGFIQIGAGAGEVAVIDLDGMFGFAVEGKGG